MRDAEGYAQRVRVTPYGPVEVHAGAVTAWFHGPYCVLTLATADGRSVVVATGDGSGVAADLVEVFAAGAAGHDMQLRDPGRVAVEQPAGDVDAPRVDQLDVIAEAGRCRLRLRAGPERWDAVLDQTEITALAAGAQAWATATTLGPAGVSAAQAPRPGAAA